MFCTQCGNEIQPEMKFCPCCGCVNVKAIPQTEETSGENSNCSEENVCRCEKLRKNPNLLLVETNVDRFSQQERTGAGLSIAGFVCGIVAFCLALGFSIVWLVAKVPLNLEIFEFQCLYNLILILTILGNCFSVSGITTNQGKGKGIAGFILSVLALAIVLTLFSL